MTFTMTPHFDRLLRGSDELPLGIYQLGLTTAEQLRRLHYQKSLSHVKELLKVLETEKYIKHAVRPTDTGGKPFYYLLADKGVRYLRSLGIDAEAPDAVKSKLFLDHTLELNDLIISAALVGQNSRFYLHHFIHERFMKKNPYRTEGVSIVPDAYLDFGIKETELRLAVLLEHDRGTEEQVFFRRKIRGYIALLRSEAHQELLGTRNITIVFTVFNDWKRLTTLRQWTLAELERSGEAGHAFLFASLDYPPYASVWTEARWYSVADNSPQALLAM